MNDRYLQSLWHKACMVAYGEKCFNPDCPNQALWVHHIIYKRRRLLRFDVSNGMPLCHDCHRKAHDIPGWERQLLDRERIAYLEERARINVKDWLVKVGMTMSEFETWEANELKAIIKGEI